MKIRLWFAKLLAPTMFYEHATMRDVLRDLVAARRDAYRRMVDEKATSDDVNSTFTRYLNTWGAAEDVVRRLL